MPRTSGDSIITASISTVSTPQTFPPGSPLQVRVLDFGEDAVNPDGSAKLSRDSVMLDINAEASKAQGDTDIAPWLVDKPQDDDLQPAPPPKSASKYSFPSISKSSFASARRRDDSQGSQPNGKGHTPQRQNSDSVSSIPSFNTSTSSTDHHLRQRNHSNLSLQISSSRNSDTLSPNISPNHSPTSATYERSLRKKASKLFRKRSRSRLAESPRQSEETVPPLPVTPTEFGRIASTSNVTLPIINDSWNGKVKKQKSRPKLGHKLLQLPQALASNESEGGAGKGKDRDQRSSDPGGLGTGKGKEKAGASNPEAKPWETEGVYFEFDPDLNNIDDIVNKDMLDESMMLTTRASATSLNRQTSLDQQYRLQDSHSQRRGLLLNGNASSSLSSIRTGAATGGDDTSSLSSGVLFSKARDHDEVSSISPSEGGHGHNHIHVSHQHSQSLFLHSRTSSGNQRVMYSSPKPSHNRSSSSESYGMQIHGTLAQSFGSSQPQFTHPFDPAASPYTNGLNGHQTQAPNGRYRFSRQLSSSRDRPSSVEEARERQKQHISQHISQRGQQHVNGTGSGSGNGRQMMQDYNNTISPKTPAREFGSVGSVATTDTAASGVTINGHGNGATVGRPGSSGVVQGEMMFDPKAGWVAPESWVIQPADGNADEEEAYSSAGEEWTGGESSSNSGPSGSVSVSGANYVNGNGNGNGLGSNMKGAMNRRLPALPNEDAGGGVPPPVPRKEGRKKKKPHAHLVGGAQTMLGMGGVGRVMHLDERPGVGMGMRRSREDVGDGTGVGAAPFASGGGGRKGSANAAVLMMNKPGRYLIRVYKSDGSYHVANMTLEATVTELIPYLDKKALTGKEKEAHRLYLKERGRERILAGTEKPAVIVRRRMEQAGYEPSDGPELLAGEHLNFLLRFNYKSQVLGDTEQEQKIENYENIDLSGTGLRTIPVSLHRNADLIVSLKLSRNPMLEIPLDFVQSCTQLRVLGLSHMSMKKVPHSLRHCVTLHRLDLSSNRIAELDEAFLDAIPGLMSLSIQNNRIEKLPWHFPRMKGLVSLNISNNKFQELPAAVTQLDNLRDLDVSFNNISELPEDIGSLKNLETLIIVGNQVSKLPDEAANLSNLKQLECRRNNIRDLSVVCMLPKLQILKADHNAVAALDMSLGPRLAELDASHNEITKLSLLPGPIGKLPYALTILDISHAKLSTLDDVALSRLSGLKTLKVSHNMFTSIPESIGDLANLETLSCSDNNLTILPSCIGRLQRLDCLDAHNNSIQELPISLWNCSSLRIINLTSNLLASWLDIPIAPAVPSGEAGIAAERKASATSLNSASRSLPPLAQSLERLYLGENSLTDDALVMLSVLRSLRILNLSFNELQDMHSEFFKNLTNLEELYLSGNKLTSLPTEDLSKMQKLRTLFLNGNKLQNLPQELGKVKNLTVLDVGSNLLKYNINNWEYDWNWNFNKNLKYLNLSGNERLQIKTDQPKGSYRFSRDLSNLPITGPLSGFSNLSQLRCLGLMDVTITTTGMTSGGIDIPDETDDRRVRTSNSVVSGMAYGIADSLGKNEQLNMLDLVHEFRDRPGEAVFAMFGRAEPPKFVPQGANTNRLAKFLHDTFLKVFHSQLHQMWKNPQKNHDITDVLRRAFLKLNQDLNDFLFQQERKISPQNSNLVNHAVLSSSAGQSNSAPIDPTVARSGASGVVLYFRDHTMYVANAGNALAVVSKLGKAEPVTRKHEPYDRAETARIRAAEGWISPQGLVNDEIDISRSFGFYHLLPVINARPDVRKVELSESDEFVIVGNRGLWDFVSYQTAVDIARQEFDAQGQGRSRRVDIAAQKLRDFALSYGAEGSTMIMVIAVADLFNRNARSRQGTSDSIPEWPMIPKPVKLKDRIMDTNIRRLNENPAPTGHITLVFTDIRNSTPLWEVNQGMHTAFNMHNNLLRRQLRFCGGYEVKTEGDAFMCSFPTALQALQWCLSVQLQLLEESWPLEILECDDGKVVYDEHGTVIAKGLSVRMGIHSGAPLCEKDPNTGRMDYFGPMVNRTARINSSAGGGQIAVSTEIVREIRAKIFNDGPDTEYSDVQPSTAVEEVIRMGVELVEVGEVRLKGLEAPEVLSFVYPKQLKGRASLKENAEATVSGSRVQFSVNQMRELGVLCLRLETLASSRVFRPISERKGSVPTIPEQEAYNPEDSSSIFVPGDPSTLLPPMSEKSSDTELMLLLDSFSVRIENALSGIAQAFTKKKPTMVLDEERIFHSLAQRGVDARTLADIWSVLQDLNG